LDLPPAIVRRMMRKIWRMRRHEPAQTAKSAA
jgi:hypothetical protein